MNERTKNGGLDEWAEVREGLWSDEWTNEDGERQLEMDGQMG